MKRILLLTDLSETALDGIKQGVQILKKLHEHEPLVFALYHSHFSNITVASMGVSLAAIDDSNEIKVVQEKFNTQFEILQHHFPEINLEKVFVRGSFIEAIKRHYSEMPFDLIVISSHSKSAITRWIFGSNAIDLLQTSPCSMLVIPPNGIFTDVRKILLATDFGNLDDLDILQPVKEIQEIHGSEVMMLHVYNPDKADPDYMVEQEGRLENYFSSAEFKYYFLDHKNPTTAIADFIAGYSADMLVLIGQDRSTFEQLFHKSISKKLVATSQMPILVSKTSQAIKTARIQAQKRQVQKWKTQIESLEVQMRLGKMDLADGVDRTKARARSQWQELKEKLENISEMSADKWKDFSKEMKESINHLGKAFGIGNKSNA